MMAPVGFALLKFNFMKTNEEAIPLYCVPKSKLSELLCYKKIKFILIVKKHTSNISTTISSK